MSALAPFVEAYINQGVPRFMSTRPKLVQPGAKLLHRSGGAGIAWVCGYPPIGCSLQNHGGLSIVTPHHLGQSSAFRFSIAATRATAATVEPIEIVEE
jgi:hypothetical protein